MNENIYSEYVKRKEMGDPLYYHGKRMKAYASRPYTDRNFVVK